MSMFSSRNWREYPRRYRLEAFQFKKSGRTYYPPRKIDPTTGDTEGVKVMLPDTGHILTYTVIRTASAQHKDLAPYALGIAELSNGTRFMAQFADCDVEKIHIGMEVRLEFRKIQSEGNAGVISYGHKFVPKWY